MEEHPSPSSASRSASPFGAELSSPAGGEVGGAAGWPAYPAHPLAELFPMMERADIERMADDICTNGQREAIVLLDGKVLDGRNRQEACAFAEIAPVYRTFDPATEGDPLAFVLSLNLERRHLTDGQRAMVAAKIVDWENALNQTTGRAHVPAREAGKKLSISERAVKAARRIRENGSDELVAAMEDGRISIKVGESLSWLAAEEQARVLAEEEKAVIARAKVIRAARQKLRHEGRVRHMALVAEAGRATAGKVGRLYPVLYADPPWKFGVRSEETGREKSAENHYPTMPTGDICDLLNDLGGVAARDAVLFLWATNPMLLDGIRVLESWGFTYVHHWIWDKEVAGTGYWGRDRHELLLIGRRGEAAAPLPGTQPETVYRERKGRHSAKPDWYAEQIERLYPGVPRIELFCRSPRPGWDAWGFEAGDGEAGGHRSGGPMEGREGPTATPPEGATEADAGRASDPRDRPEDDDPRLAISEIHERTSNNDEACLKAVPQDGPSPAGIGSKLLAGRDVRHEGGVAPTDTPTFSGEDLYACAVALVRETRRPHAAVLRRALGTDWDTAGALLARMATEGVLEGGKVSSRPAEGGRV